MNIEHPKVKYLCGGSVDLVDINNEKSLFVLDACLRHETQHKKRVTMLRALKSRIKKLGTGAEQV